MAVFVWAVVVVAELGGGGGGEQISLNCAFQIPAFDQVTRQHIPFKLWSKAASFKDWPCVLSQVLSTNPTFFKVCIVLVWANQTGDFHPESEM